MTKPKFFTPKFIENALRFLIYFLVVAVTPWLAKPFAPLFDWVGYSQLRGLFAEIFTVLFWGLEALAMYFIARKLSKKQTQTEETSIEETQEQEQEKPKAKKAKKEPLPPMPLKNLLILTGICVACVLLVSIVIGFKVKPFYDIGEKVTGHQLFCRIAIIARNALKCIWLVGMLRACKGMADEMMATSLQGKKEWLTWVLTGSILMLFGIFDIFTSVVSYPMKTTQWLLALTYFLFYIAFTAVHKFTEERAWKTYLLVMFIYLF